MTKEEALQVLRAHAKGVGGGVAWAKMHGLNQSFVNDVLAQRRQMSDRILETVGIRKRVTYEWI